MRSWQAAEAKQNFGRLVDAAQTEPQVVLKHADPVGVLLSMEHYRRLVAQANTEFAAFLIATPMEEGDFAKDVGMSLSDG